MPPMEYGYMEGDQLGKPYDLRLLGRLGSYLTPFWRQVALAGALIILATLLDLLLPYITRLAIDDYMVRQAQEINLDAAGPELDARLKAEAGDELLPAGPGRAFIAESVWRGLDSRLKRPLKDAGAVGEKPWFLAPDAPASGEVAAQKPGLFVKAGGRWLIPTDELGKLPKDLVYRLRGPDAWGLGGLALVFLAASGLTLLLNFSQAMLLERAGQRMMLNMRQELFKHLIGRTLAWLDKEPVGKLVTRLTNDIANINEMFRTTLVALLQDFFLLAGIVVVLLWLELRLALICLALTPFIAALAWVFSRMSREAFRRLQGYLGRLNARLSETLDGLAVIKLFRAEALGRKEYEDLNQAHYRAGKRQIFVFTAFFPLTELFASIAVGLIIYYGGGLVVSEQISLGTLVAFLAYMQMFFRPVRDLAEKYNVLQAAMASGERIFNLLDSGEALAWQDPGPDPDGPGRVALEGVTFGYREDRPVIKAVSFAIPPGRTWAVVGPTGAGKTSLVNLILRLWDPWEGRVTLDGRDLRELSREQIARAVSLVPQEVFLLSGTVRENLTLGRDWVTEEMLTRALEVTGADKVVRELPQGLDTPLGEGARKLSSGQRQILALARALAGDPKVLVLDEATSSVDPASERLIQEALPRVMAGRTALVVAHRLSTVRSADRILVMRRGELVEQGTHEELMAAGGVYARLVELNEMRAHEPTAGRGEDEDGPEA